MGGLEESATGTLGEISKPISYHKPADKICENLKKKDTQVCDLRFGNRNKLIDLEKTVIRVNLFRKAN